MRRALRFFRQAIDRFDRINAAACALLFLAVVLMAGGEIVARNLFQNSSVEMVDLSLQCAILMYFLGYASLLNREQDIRMDYFYVRFPGRLRKIIDVLTWVAIAGFFLLLLVKSFTLFRMGLNQRHPVFPIPNALIIVPAVLGASAGLLVAVRKLLDAVSPSGARR